MDSHCICSKGKSLNSNSLLFLLRFAQPKEREREGEKARGREGRQHHHWPGCRQLVRYRQRGWQVIRLQITTLDPPLPPQRPS